MSTDTLRRHLAKQHAEAYTAACAKYGWPVKGILSLLPVNLAKMVEPQSAVNFTKEGFLSRLVEFIVANDEVCSFEFFEGQLNILQAIRVVECPEFRQLLVYASHGHLQDRDIAH